jgi:hypothetical protein
VMFFGVNEFAKFNDIEEAIELEPKDKGSGVVRTVVGLFNIRDDLFLIILKVVVV